MTSFLILYNQREMVEARTSGVRYALPYIMSHLIRFSVLKSKENVLTLVTSIFFFLLTPWSRVLLEKLIGFQPVKKFHRILWSLKFYYRSQFYMYTYIYIRGFHVFPARMRKRNNEIEFNGNYIN